MERLAIDGGEPVRRRSFGPPWNLGDEEIAALTAVIRSGTLVERRGSVVERLEAALAERFGVRHVLACTSGTAACHIGVAMLDLEPGDEVISAPIGDVATVAGAVLQNLVPVFADINPETLTLDTAPIEAAITPRTRALIPVHFLGQPADMAAILEIARRHDLAVVEDCAQAMLSRRDDRLVGTFGDVGCFSVSNKLIITGQGGFVVTDDDQAAARGRLFRDVARRGLAPALQLGTAYLMTDLQAAVSLTQLDKADGYVDRQAAAAERLRERLAGVPGLRILGDDARSRPNRLFVAIRVDPAALGPAGPVADAVRAEGIPAIFPYDEPIYRHPLFLEQRTYGRSGYPFRGAGRPPVDYSAVACPVTEDVLATTAMIRMNQSWTDDDVDDVARALAKVAEAFAARAVGASA